MAPNNHSGAHLCRFCELHRFGCQVDLKKNSKAK